MSDQIEVQFPKTVVDEKSAFDIVAYFRTRATKVALAPTTIRYKIDCLSTKTALVGWTTVSAAASVTITVTSAANEIQDNSHRRETKQIIINADNGLSTEIIKTANWKVNNVYGIQK